MLASPLVVVWKTEGAHFDKTTSCSGNYVAPGSAPFDEWRKAAIHVRFLFSLF
jgi:hypothetical protein